MTRMEEIAATLIEHAQATDAHQDRQDREIESLRASVRETNASVQSLIGAIRGLIDRIPPENLR